MVKVAACLMVVFLSIGHLVAQDTLPKFTVNTRGNNRVLVSWTNNYKTVGQISIQRSLDSLKNFKTILSVPDPNVPQNGFVDTKAPAPNMFYRLFIVLDSGKYVFTKSKRPEWDSSKIEEKPVPEAKSNGNKRVIISDSMSAKEADKLREKLNENKTAPVDSTRIAPKPVPEKFFIVKRRDSIITEVSEKRFKFFRDSVVNKTKDTLVFRTADTIVIKPFVPKEVYRPSVFVFTEKDGNVQIALPDHATKHYAIKFFDDKGNPLFELPKVKESPVVMDKVNFLHAGWFRFELYEDGKLKEKNKFFIPKDF